MFESYCDRAKVLRAMLTYPDPNSAILAKRFELHLHPLERAVKYLEERFSESTRQREEGFMLKPVDTPYLGWHHWMKLKKDHIPGLGDTLDFCLVGAAYNPQRGEECLRSLYGVKWNTYHVGCLLNKSEVIDCVCSPFLPYHRTLDQSFR
jgi:DNA ligase 4